MPSFSTQTAKPSLRLTATRGRSRLQRPQKPSLVAGTAGRLAGREGAVEGVDLGGVRASGAIQDQRRSSGSEAYLIRVLGAVVAALLPFVPFVLDRRLRRG